MDVGRWRQPPRAVGVGSSPAVGDDAPPRERRPLATSAVGDDVGAGVGSHGGATAWVHLALRRPSVGEEKKRQAIVEKHFDVSWLELDCDARANLLYYLVDHGKVEEEDIAFTDDGGAFAADGAQPGSEGDAGWVAMLE